MHDRDRIGLIGVNGSGKSTLLRIVVGDGPEGSPDAGLVTRKRHLRVEYVPQEPRLDGDRSVEETLRDRLRDHAAAVARLEALAAAIPDLAGAALEAALVLCQKSIGRSVRNPRRLVSRSASLRAAHPADYNALPCGDATRTARRGAEFLLPARRVDGSPASVKGADRRQRGPSLGRARIDRPRRPAALSPRITGRDDLDPRVLAT